MLRALLWRASLGLVAGMTVQGSLLAQDTTQARRDSLALRARATADSARDDSLRSRARLDSIEAERRRLVRQRQIADSIKAPLAHAEAPVGTDIGTAHQWDRTTVFATGALTLGELLDRVPGVTGYRSAWIGSPHVAAFMGDFRRVRVFYDGLELDALDPRLGGMLDLSFPDLMPLEDVRIEQGANEVRVYLRSWRVRSTTASTRVDVNTGDLQTNVFRGYLGRRYAQGQALQLGFYQLSDADVIKGGDTHNLSLWGRLGWAWKAWSFDASLLRTSRNRVEQERDGGRPLLPKLDATMSTSYARAAYGDPDAGVWAQAVLGTEKFTIHNPSSIVLDSIPGPGGGGPGGSSAEPDTVTLSRDTTTAHPQILLTGGWSRGPLRISAAGRSRRVAGSTKVSPGIRASWETRRLTVSAYGERSPADGWMRTDLSARLLPLSFLAMGGSIGRTAPLTGTAAPASLAMRGELGVRLGRLWVTGGMMMRDTATLPAPIVFDTAFKASAQGQLTGYFATLQGKFWRDLGLDVVGVRFGAGGNYLPQYQARSQLYFESGFPGRFPSGNLHILAAVTHEYRTRAFFPVSPSVVLRSSQYRTWGALLEIRLLTATLTYQYRNFLNADYSQVPGFAMPRPVNFYGIRWNFFD